MARPLPSKPERLVRAFLLLMTSAGLTLLAWSLGFNQSQDTTRTAIAVVTIIMIAVLVSRLATKPVMRFFGWKP